MKVKEILDLLPTGQSYRFVVNNQWRDYGRKNDNNYNRVLEYYKDYYVISTHAYIDVLWLTVVKREDTNYSKTSDSCLFKESEFHYLEKYNDYTILKASLNPHNSEYVIQEFGFNTRWTNLKYCKKYIKDLSN